MERNEQTQAGQESLIAKEAIKEYHKRYHAENREKIAERKKKYYFENKDARREYLRKYNAERREERKKYQKQYYTENREAVAQAQRKYSLANREEKREYYRKYNSENREAILEGRRKKKEEERAGMDEKEREEAEKRDLDKKREYHRAYYSKNREARREDQRRWSSKNKEERRAYQKSYSDENREKKKEYTRKYQKEKRQAIHNLVNTHQELVKEELESKFRISHPEDWYNITREQFYAVNGVSEVSKTATSLPFLELLEKLYPSQKWKPELLLNVPTSTWRDPEKNTRFFETFGTGVVYFKKRRLVSCGNKTASISRCWFMYHVFWIQNFKHAPICFS
eukprot:TRINITY_DN4596_c0_g2_i1.p1 TRINITY_DN4596_c0_g2~~TRINITY_DN4596_c0_g2_i1.p1  ORF type:complete len:375 (-),score=88.56 TRINITY_DN4596_c0_g2_i1:631-1647(-)